MKRLFKCAALMGALIATVLAGPAAAETIYVKAGRVIADPASEPLGPTLIVIEDGRIVELLPVQSDEAQETVAGLVAENAMARYTDLSDKTVLPGLIDLHTHLSGDPSGEFWRAATTPPEYYTLIAAKNARITALAGFTTIRDLGSRSDQVTQALRSA
ncbi:MAG: amidohydrolase family protein, partial [Pseudomonadota bacterium]